MSERGALAPRWKTNTLRNQRGANAPRSLEKDFTKSLTPFRHCAALFVRAEQKPECIVIKGDSVMTATGMKLSYESLKPA